MTEHTPTPWHLSSAERNLPAAGMVFAGTRPVASCMLRQSNIPGNTEREENEANAEYIVRAANSHEDLLADMRNIAETARQLLVLKTASGVVPADLAEVFVKGCDKIARAAIAKAGVS